MQTCRIASASARALSAIWLQYVPTRSSDSASPEIVHKLFLARNSAYDNVIVVAVHGTSGGIRPTKPAPATVEIAHYPIAPGSPKGSCSMGMIPITTSADDVTYTSPCPPQGVMP